MSEIRSLSSIKEKKRPAVSPKCLLSIKSIVTHNVSLNNHHRNGSIRAPPPLPLDLTTESNNHQENQGKKSQLSSNTDLANEFVEKLKISNGHNQSNIENDQSIRPYSIVDSSSITPAVIDKESNPEQYTSTTLNNHDLSIVPPLPLCSSMYRFGSSSAREKPLTSFPVRSSNQINEEYVAQMRRIIASSSSSSSENQEETKLMELTIHHQKSIAIHQLTSTSSTVSTNEDDIEENDDLPAAATHNGPLIFVNSSLNSPPVDTKLPSTIVNHSVLLRPHFSDSTTAKVHRYHPSHPTNFLRLPHLLRNSNPPLTSSLPSESAPTSSMSHPRSRHSMPSLESVRTSTPPTTPSIPEEMFNCCQTDSVNQRRSFPRNTHRQSTIIETEARSIYFRNVEKIRELMIQASKRLTEDLLPTTSLPIVDTHCHFDLIFDRLRIKHNNLKKYFQDYSEYYPSGLSFQLAIQVFWRPKQLLENNWMNWYSKYLDDERVYGACGIHPHWSSAWTETTCDDIERCLQHPKIVAIGEIGLDFGPKNICEIHEQYRAFEGQLKIAAKLLKPIVIHSRDAYADTFRLMKKYLQSNHKIHLHCFVGTIDDVHLFTSYFTEIKFGFTPIITRSNFLHSVIEQLPLTQILSETDSPYFIPEELNKYSRSAHPGMVYSVVETIAQIRHLSIFDIACQLRENARQIYGI